LVVDRNIIEEDALRGRSELGNMMIFSDEGLRHLVAV
jgi:hypothetical protein